MNDEKYSLNDIPAEFLEAGVDPDCLPTPAEIRAIPSQQSLTIEQIMTNGEIAIIDLGKLGGLYVYWRLDGRGLTVGMRLETIFENKDLGSMTISQDNPTITLTGPDVAGYQATLSAGVNTSQCELFVSVKLKCGFPIHKTLEGKLAVPYGKPWPQFKPGKIVADGITPEMAENIRNAPAKSFNQPPPGFIQNDAVTSAAVQTLLWLMNAAGYISEIQLSAEAIQAENAEFDPNNLLLAIGISGQGGVGIGVEMAMGVYITGGGEVGWFGSGGVDIGAFASISIGIPVYVFWTGTKGFGGVSMGINISVGKSLGPECPIGVGVTVSIFWSLGQPQSGLPSGFCLNFSIGASPFPLGGYASFGYTYIGKLGQVWRLPQSEPALPGS